MNTLRTVIFPKRILFAGYYLELLYFICNTIWNWNKFKSLLISVNEVVHKKEEKRIVNILPNLS